MTGSLTPSPPGGPGRGSVPLIWALVPCAGTGSRAGTAVPKQYQPVAGRAMVLHTLAAFDAVDAVHATLVAVSPGDEFLAPWVGQGRWRTAACGGATRAATVAGGLAQLLAQGADPLDWVLVHDAARCLVTPASIARLIAACRHDAVGGLLAHPVADTLKRAVGDRVGATTDRSGHWLAQTPQMFRIGPLRDALLAAGHQVTDESSAMEVAGLRPLLVPGSAENFKVTYPQDFALAQAVLQARQPSAVERRPDYDYP